MLRQVASSLRVGLLIAGVMLVLWIPVSFDSPAWCVVSYDDGDRIGLHAEDGSVILVVPSLYGRPGFYFERGNSFFYSEANALRPVTRRFYVHHVGFFRTVSLPLWLLAFLCLAWPVTSFVIARRRRGGRGFDVELRDSAHA